MNKSIFRFIQSMIGLGLAVYLAEKLVNGQITYYINARFTIFIIIGIAGLLAMVLTGLWPLFHEQAGPGASPAARRKGFLAGMPLIPVTAAFLGYSTPVLITLYLFVVFFGMMRLYILFNTEPEAFSSPSDLSVTTLIILSVPLILGSLVPVKPLSTSSLTTRGMSLSAPSAIGDQTFESMEISPDDRTVLDWVKLFNYEENLSDHIGTTADVIGFVYHDPRLEDGRFMVGRFIITCCVADAFAVGMVVDAPGSVELEENSWVNVKGAVDVTTIDGRKVPLIHAQSVIPVPAPDQPYLYP
ncbi:MAG: TIGR03943 family protein [Anaerolineaceae bacterium]